MPSYKPQMWTEMTQRWRQVAAALVLCLPLACGPISTSVTQPTVTGANVTPPGASNSPAPASGAASASTIKVGLLLSRTGSFASIENDNLDGFNLYLADHGGSMAGRTVEVVVRMMR